MRSTIYKYEDVIFKFTFIENSLKNYLPKRSMTGNVKPSSLSFSSAFIMNIKQTKRDVAGRRLWK